MSNDAIAIDGPAGAGKTTLGCWLAEQLGWSYLETGLLYRAAAWVLLGHANATRLSGSLLDDVEVRVGETPRDGTPTPIYVGDALVPLCALRQPAIDRLVTPVASCSSVRSAVNDLCRHAVSQAPTVAVGRDVATAVAPNAYPKFALYARPAVLHARLGGDSAPRLHQEQALLSLEARPTGTIAIDTSDLTVNQVRDMACYHIAGIVRHGQ